MSPGSGGAHGGESSANAARGDEHDDSGDDDDPAVKYAQDDLLGSRLIGDHDSDLATP